MFSALRSILRPEIAAVSTLMLMLTLIALTLVALVLRRSGDSAEEVAEDLRRRVVHLTPTEEDRLRVFTAAQLARATLASNTSSSST